MLGGVLIGRGDIIGDIARLQREYLGAANEADKLLSQLEVLTAAAVQLGMSQNIVGKASGIPAGRIDAVLDAQPMGVRRCAETYALGPSGVVARRDRPDRN